MEVLNENKIKAKDKDKDEPINIVLSLDKSVLDKNIVINQPPLLDSPLSNDSRYQYSQTPRIGVPEEDDSTEVSSDSSGNMVSTMGGVFILI